MQEKVIVAKLLYKVRKKYFLKNTLENRKITIA